MVCLESSAQEPIRRCGIYFFCDKDGIVDEYNLYLLKDLKENLDKLLVVCDGALTPEGKTRLESVADEVLVREGPGFEAWAYKAGMAHYGWQQLCQYDELVLLDYTHFGPVYPLREMFDSMSRREADFWGIVKRCNPDHIPMAFMVIRKNLISSDVFQNYWNTLQEINSREDSAAGHESNFTREFAALGFTYDLYIDVEDLREYCDDPLMLYPLELVRDRRCPVVKRNVFFNRYGEFFSGSCGQAAAEVYNYLRQETRYDVNLIWDNLLRTGNMADIKDRMQLNHILPKAGLIPLKPGVREDRRIALLMHIYFEDQIDWCCHYAASMPQHADIHVTTDSAGKKQLIRERFKNLKCGKLRVNVVENRGRDVGALLMGGRDIMGDYDYICCAHDKKVTHTRPLRIGQSFAYKCFENILASEDFACNVIRTFEENPRLGLLAPPPPQHSVYIQTIGNEWEQNFDNAVKLAGMLNLQVDMDADKVPVAPLGGMFWFRSQALKKIFYHDWTYEDFPAELTAEVDGTILHAIERIYPFVAQDAGYYSGWLLSDEFARMEITNLNYVAHTKLREKDDAIAELHWKLDEKEQLMAKAAETIAVQQAELSGVYNSRSWRLTSPLRWLIAAFRRS